MKRLTLIIFVLFLAVGMVHAKDFEMTKKAGECTVLVTIDKNPPIVGDNNLSLAIKDGMGMEIKDAKVSVEYSMAAMPGMPAAKYKTDTVLKGGEYKAKLNFSMAGGWSMVVRIIRGNKTAQAKFNVDVR